MTGMNARSDFDVLIATWLTDDGPADVRPEVIDRALEASMSVRPRQGVAAWLAGVRPWPGGRDEGVQILSRRVLLIALIAALAVTIGALATAAPRHRLSLLGEIAPTGPMAAAVWRPATEVLPDGSVLVVGPVPDQWLHAERWDPVTGRFTLVEGLPRARAVPGSYGSVRLPDGSVLLIVARYGEGSRVGASGGFALRFDPATGTFRPAGTFASSVIPASAAEFAFADWPATVEPDGSVRWMPVGPDVGEPVIVYDPVADAFATEATAAARPDQPFEDWPVIVLADGHRTLSLHWTEQGTDGTVRDADGSVVASVRWPLVHGGLYDGILLPDGRVLLVGDSIAIVDPDTGGFEAVEVPAWLVIRGRWLDGRILLEGTTRLPNDPAGPATGRYDAQPWVFDPASNRFSMLSNARIPGPSTWTVLGDGRVLIVSEDNGAWGTIEPVALLLW